MSSQSDRLDALERDHQVVRRALQEMIYLTHGPHGLPSLQRQAPAAARLLDELLTATVPTRTFVGRADQSMLETTANTDGAGEKR